jgi:diphthamide synthase subunit DPH2
MFLARFSYDVQPVNRQRAIDLIRREVEAARQDGLNARMLVPLTRGAGGPALQFEIELTSLDQLEQFRRHGVGSREETGDWMQAFSEILVTPPEVEILRTDEMTAS